MAIPCTTDRVWYTAVNNDNPRCIYYSIFASSRTMGHGRDRGWWWGIIRWERLWATFV